MGIEFKHKGNFVKTEKFLKEAHKGSHFRKLDKFGKAGVEALAMATPVDSGLTADSWRYEIIQEGDIVKLSFYNKNRKGKGGWFDLAIGLQLGHGTRNGGWVEGIDYINPAIRPVFEKMKDDIVKEVRGL